MNNKKHISIFFLFILLFSNVGLSYNVHYCKGKIDNVSISYLPFSNCEEHQVSNCEEHKKSKSCCDNSETNKDKDCCKNDVVSQISTDNTFIKTYLIGFDFFQQNQNSNILDYVVFESYENQVKKFYALEESSPTPLFKLYCRYIFYA